MSDLTRTRIKNLGLVIAFFGVIAAWGALFIWPWFIFVWIVSLVAIMVYAVLFVWPFEDEHLNPAASAEEPRT